jgi:heme/copper-type cytochrome/quinol oxidase subunit 2
MGIYNISSNNYCSIVFSFASFKIIQVKPLKY